MTANENGHGHPHVRPQKIPYMNRIHLKTFFLYEYTAIPLIDPYHVFIRFTNGFLLKRDENSDFLFCKFPKRVPDWNLWWNLV